MKPPDTYSSNGMLTIVFHSDDAEAGTGFEAHIVPTGIVVVQKNLKFLYTVGFRRKKN